MMKPGQWVRHTVGESSTVVRIEHVSDDVIRFHDLTHADVQPDMSFLVHCPAPGIPQCCGELVATLQCRHCGGVMPGETWKQCFGDIRELSVRDEYGYWSWRCGCNGEDEFCGFVATKAVPAGETMRPTNDWQRFPCTQTPGHLGKCKHEPKAGGELLVGSTR